mmetsp:Transcript_48566/g.105337  ORF Transcript_48566/g.105337 Transcript_48566/m.105337 type:complete len:242 (-) Transcript_48566:81-806(-)
MAASRARFSRIMRSRRMRFGSAVLVIMTSATAAPTSTLERVLPPPPPRLSATASPTSSAASWASSSAPMPSSARSMSSPWATSRAPDMSMGMSGMSGMPMSGISGTSMPPSVDLTRLYTKKTGLSTTPTSVSTVSNSPPMVPSSSLNVAAMLPQSMRMPVRALSSTPSALRAAAARTTRRMKAVEHSWKFICLSLYGRKPTRINASATKKARTILVCNPAAADPRTRPTMNLRPMSKAKYM